jgi:DNA-binding CsgD family transcriptional regulator
MSIRYRPMRPNDARDCAEVIAAHPVLAARYGDVIQHLSSAWSSLLGSDAFTAVVFEELEGAKRVVLGAGIAVFVTDDFTCELKRHPSLWFGPELAIRVARGESPLLTDKQVREANSSGGLNLLCWQPGVLPENLLRGEVSALIMTSFVELFRGFLLKETFAQAESFDHAEALRLTGALLWNPSEESYGGFSGVSPAELIKKPHVIGMTRDLAVKNGGSWAASMFLYQPPQFGFSRSEQRLLLSALNGATDQELGDELGISLSTVKKTWRLIYGRVAASRPEMIPFNSAVADNGTSERGKEKKPRLIAYLREHLEELRPVSRKLLRQRGPRVGSSPLS